jgi:hypothetical protein
MARRKPLYVFVIVLLLALIFFTMQTLAASPVFVSPPNIVEVIMYRLHSDGSIYGTTPEVRAGCATPENQIFWGCTTFDVGRTLGITVTVVPYPYGSTPAPEVAFETDYLMDVIPQEMSVDPAEPSSLTSPGCGRPHLCYAQSISNTYQ